MKIKKDFYQVKIDLEMEKSKRILAFSDLHYGILSQMFYQEYLHKFYSSILENYRGNLDFILLPGDLFFFF